MKKLLLIALIAAVALAGCVVPPLKLNPPNVATSPQIVVRFDWGNPSGPYGTYITGTRQQTEFADDVNRILGGELRLGPNDQLTVSVHKVGYLMNNLIATRIETEMGVTLHVNGATYKKVLTDNATSSSTNVDDVMRGVRASVLRVLDQVVDFVRNTRQPAR